MGGGNYYDSLASYLYDERSWKRLPSTTEKGQTLSCKRVAVQAKSSVNALARPQPKKVMWNMVGGERRAACHGGSEAALRDGVQASPGLFIVRCCSLLGSLHHGITAATLRKSRQSRHTNSEDGAHNCSLQRFLPSTVLAPSSPRTLNMVHTNARCNTFFHRPCVRLHHLGHAPTPSTHGHAVERWQNRSPHPHAA